MKTLVDMMDILGVYFLLNQFLKGDRENKILSVIIGNNHHLEINQILVDFN